MAKSDRIVTRLEHEARERLHAKASALGLDDAAYVRMLIYRDLNGLEAAAVPAAGPPPREPEAIRGVARFRQPHAPRLPNSDQFIGAEKEVPEPLPVEEMDIPADADDGDPGALDELLAAGPSILDEMLAMNQPAPAPMPAQQAPRNVPHRSYRPALSRRQGLQPAYGPGSMTRAIGVNDQSVGTNDFGDGVGNVLRDNMKHFGISGTRAR